MGVAKSSFETKEKLMMDKEEVECHPTQQARLLQLSNKYQDLLMDPKWSHHPEEAWERLKVKQTVDAAHLISPCKAISEDKIRFVCVSDTHNSVENKPALFPQGDVLLHAGDFTMAGIPAQLDAFNKFLGTLEYKVKVVIAGNHDMCLDEESIRSRRQYLKIRFRIGTPHLEDYLSVRGVDSSRELLTNCVYLQDTSINLCGINIYGSPWVPEFCGMGFNVIRGQPLVEKWNLIPSDTNILLTHTPPLGRGDLCDSGSRAGCLDLLRTVQQRVKPEYHVYGHIHEGYGASTDGTTTFINSSTCTLRYKPVNPPIVFDFPIPSGHTKEELNNFAFR